ncbi:RrF2 family transcriptional regulator [Haliea sp. E17]|uniref:RrF2 family transcriptional regulator n=1 Tax=Haliea sp. E17 TaxID=3401576 RepID=UPI003AAC245A
MKLSLYTDFSLRVLLYIGTNSGRRVTMAEIADSYGISREHLRKVVHLLGKLGYIETHRGKGGGFTLGADAAKINIGDVVEATEPRQPVIDCSPCILVSACTLQSVLQEAEKAFYDVLKGYCLSDLLKNKAMQQILLRTSDT